MEDEEIIGLYFARSQSAIAETSKKYGRYCYSIAYNILSNHQDAEECVNDALMNTWKSIPPQRPVKLRAFVGELTRCAGLKKWRDAHAGKRGGGEVALALEELDECVSSGHMPEQEVEAEELGDAVNTFVMSLGATERSVFICRYWYMKSIRDIAAQFEFSESKVKSMLSRTRSKLKNYLIKEKIYDEH